jgi:hypothetical protein
MATKNSVNTSKLAAIVEKLNMVAKHKANSFKVWPANGSIKRSLDISTNKHGTTVQVLLVGFTMTEGVSILAKPPAATATQVMIIDAEEVKALRSFYQLCKTLIALSAPAVVPVATPDATSSPEPEAKEEAPVAEPEQEAAVA